MLLDPKTDITSSRPAKTIMFDVAGCSGTKQYKPLQDLGNGLGFRAPLHQPNICYVGIGSSDGDVTPSVSEGHRLCLVAISPE